MKQLKEEGSVSKIGYSLYLPLQLEKLLEAGFIPDLVQVPFNFLDRRFEKYFAVLSSMGCEIHIRSAFLQGLFFLNPDQLSSFFTPVKSILLELQSAFPNKSNLAGYLMNFVLNNRDIGKLVFGVNTHDQLLQNVNSLKHGISEGRYSWKEDLPEDILRPDKWPQNK
jgi:aryl-alcohol dehydrogenase-like predicted oxidoreductase